MFQTTPILDLPLIQTAQAQKHVTHNEALVALDALVQPVALDADRTEPPLNPDEGDVHIVAAPAAGPWLGRAGQIAHFSNGGWRFHAPRPGWRMQVLSETAAHVFDGTAWQAEGGAGQVDVLGVNTAADSTNRLAVAAEATLLSHDGGGHQVKVNKAAPGDTNSLLFQTGWSGRAEMGCAGDDAFSIKVSADGTAWTTALRLDPATGSATLPRHPKFSGYLNYDQLITPASTWVEIDINALRHDAAASVSQGRFTAPHAGVFVFLGGMRYKPDQSAPSSITLGFSVNGASPEPDTMSSLSRDLDAADSVNTQAVLDLSAGDSVSLATYFGGQAGYVDGPFVFFAGYQLP